ncbi:hypothetical protein WA026_003955 [Henosepilachna vigintioctopunctata]|uniref:HIG1 domain-containing protein n=1 Tax=Henosepilachna vigintioctopunctata TaxID=420089 RepID=A0AAW1UF61_9CUCU
MRSQFDWVQLRKDMGTKVVETQSEKFIRKLKENPLVPIGCIVTSCCLGFGLYTFKTGDRRMSQLMMRSRVAAQGFTVFSYGYGIGIPWKIDIGYIFVNSFV